MGSTRNDGFSSKGFDTNYTSTSNGNFSGNSYNNHEDEYMNKIGKLCWLGFGVIFLLIMLLFSPYKVSDAEYAVITTFGSPTVVDTPGLKFKIPFIQKVNKVPKSIMGMSIGYDPTTNYSIDSESMMITSDFNFVNVDFYVEYRVSDPVKAVIHSDSYYSILKNLAQSYIRDTIGVYTVDDVLTTGKTQIQAEIQEKLKQRLIEEDIGYVVERVSMQDSELPNEAVMAAFNAVEDAKQSMETKLNDANKDRNTRIPAVEAEVDKILKQAEAYKQERINEATGQVARFESMYEEYQKYPLITKKRMYYEAIEDVLPSLKVIINGSDGTQTMLPLSSFSSTVVNSSSSND